MDSTNISLLQRELPYHGTFRAIIGFKFAVLLTTFCMFVSLFISAVHTPFSSKGEAREALAGQAVFTDGEWILPRRYGEEFITKPPMTYWLMAGAASLTGSVSEFVARVPSLLAGMMVVVLLFVWCVRELSYKHALVSTLILVSSPFWLRSSVTARVDMTLTGFWFSALVCTFYWLQAKSKKALWGGAAVGFLTAATLTKGPVALVLSVIIAGLYLCTTEEKYCHIVKRLSLLILPAVFLSALWYLAAIWRGGWEFLSVFEQENFGRLTGTMATGKQPHEHSVIYLWGTLLIGFAPFSLSFFVFPRATGERLLSWLKQIIHKTFYASLLRSFLSAQPIQRFSIVTTVIFIAFFSIPSSKRAEYLLPAYPFIACLVAVLFFRNRQNFICRLYCLTQIMGSAVIAAYTLGGLSVVALFLLSNLLEVDSRFFTFACKLADALIHEQGSLSLLLLVAPAFAFFGTFFFRKVFSHDAILLARIACFQLLLIVIFAVVAPLVAEQLSPRRFAAEVRTVILPGEKVYSLDRLYELNFYLQGQAEPFELESFDVDKPAYIVVRTEELPSLEKAAHAKGLRLEKILQSEMSMRKIGDTLVLTMLKQDQTK